jgi:hypothetical protein
MSPRRTARTAGTPARALALGIFALAAASAFATVAAPRQDGMRGAGMDDGRGTPPQLETRPAGGGEGSDGCVHCHQGIEDMHPAHPLACVDCHGGDATTKNKLEAHVPSQAGEITDERVAPEDRNLAFRRFINPMDLRIVPVTCGVCHDDLCKDLRLSLHGTTAGHLSDGFYEMGLSKEKGSRWSVFDVPAHLTDRGEVQKLQQAPAFENHRPKDELGTHFPDLVRKECMQCHLYSEGRAVRGRVGFDGDYRGEGCAACHVPYTVDGLSDSADRTVNRNEPGHPWRHALTRSPATQTCVTCHYGDASIGMHYRGLSQLPPDAPGGPEIEGTTDALLNRSYYLNDNAIAPPDVHHEQGMHCIDCHTLGDVMGDGALHGQMEHAVEISCEACHGTFEAQSTMRTERGTPLTHLFKDGDDVYLRSKVTGKAHRIRQVVDVLDRTHRDYNPEAEKAMTGAHGSLECYTCHAGWNINFLGFHFYRNESLTQLDLISGAVTPGRVTTQEKVFTTWKSFYAGRNEAGRVAPYLTGFSTMGTVDGADGERIIDQVMPETQAGLSGMTMVHHQLHSTRPTARSCVECHRSSATWGLGSNNFRLARQLAFVADRRGIEVVALSRGNLAASTPLAKVVLPDVVDIELWCDPLQGRAQYLFATEGSRGIHVIDVRDPTAPKRVAFTESIAPRGMALAGEHLYLADGVGGLRVYDVSKPAKPKIVGRLPLLDAHEIELRWPYAYVADGPGGLAIVDVRDPISPRLVGGTKLAQRRGGEDKTVDVEVLFQYSRPEAHPDGSPAPFRSRARCIAAVVDEEEGLFLVDVTEPTHPEVLSPRRGERTQSSGRGVGGYFHGLALRSKVDVATPQGGLPTRERDYVYLLQERVLQNGDSRSRLHVIDVSDPKNPERLDDVEVGDVSEMLTHASFYNQPSLLPVAFVAGNEGVYVTDLSVSLEPNPIGVLAALRSSYVVAVEEFPLDAMVDASGQPLKDVSHPGSRWFHRSEILSVLDVSGLALGTLTERSGQVEIPAAAARTFFARNDKDRDNLLTGKEVERAGASFDANGDGRLTLLEVAQLAARTARQETEAPVDDPLFRVSRVDRDGDLARLFDGVEPFDFDRDGDRRLDRRETSKALFAALDLDGDERLTRAELSRHPGKLRQLRYGDVGALAMFNGRDLNRGGTISSRELQVQDAEWDALDVDGDGYVQLPPDPDDMGRRAGVAPARSEWPTRQPRYTVLPPVITLEQLSEVFDRDGDGVFTKRELKNRPDLFEEADRDRDGVVTRAELGDRVALVTNGGVEVTASGFRARWDLDGNGKVEDVELPEAARIVRRR